MTADGRRLAPQPLPPGIKRSDRTWELPRAGEYERLTVAVPSKGEGKLWLILVSEGVRESDGAPYGGEGLKLARRWLDAAGNEIGGAAAGGASTLSGVKLGDLVYVELTLHNTSGERMSNIALVDRIPAGWEIENPRLGGAMRRRSGWTRSGCGPPITWICGMTGWRCSGSCRRRRSGRSCMR